MIERILDWIDEFKIVPMWSKIYMITHPHANYHARKLAWYKHCNIKKYDDITEEYLDFFRERSNIKIDY